MNNCSSFSFDHSNNGDLYLAQENLDFTDIIKQYADELRALNRSTEQDFISIGTGLNDIHGQSKRISEIADSAIQLITDINKAENIENLHVVFDSINKHLQNTQNKIDKSTSFLKSMLDKSKDSKMPLEIFKKIVKHLRVLSVSTKIENARLGTNDNSFDVLAEDIEKLSESWGQSKTNINKILFIQGHKARHYKDRFKHNNKRPQHTIRKKYQIPRRC
jgi:methyl-accepting chemotaxis protein